MLALLLALGASLFWGLGDIVAGLTSRRGSAIAVTAMSQVAGAAGAAGVLLLLGRAWPGWPGLLPALLAGMALSISAATYFRALAIGTMSVVGPIGASGAAVPVVVGMVQGERPSLLQVAGIVIALAGIVLASRESPEAKVPVTPGEMLPPEEVTGRTAPTPGDYRRSILLAVVSALTYGLLLLGLARSAQYDPYWPPFITRTVSLLILSLVIVSKRQGLGLSPRAAGVAFVAGLCHVTAVTLFSLSSTLGLLSIAAVLASLSSVVVILLARMLLDERLTRVQQAGVGLTVLGVVAIVGG
jgi:uncharacterized membrane protein